MKRLFTLAREKQLADEYLAGGVTLQQIANREGADLSTIHKIVKRNAAPHEIGLARGRNHAASKRGIPRPPLVVESIRLANTGPQVARICPTCAALFHSPVEKSPSRRGAGRGRFCSRRCEGLDRRLRVGPLSAHWKGGVTRLADLIRGSATYHEWRVAVFRRDGFKCQRCGGGSGRLEAHHIEPFREVPERRFDVANGITLCIVCHAEVDPCRRRLSPVQLREHLAKRDRRRRGTQHAAA